MQTVASTTLPLTQPDLQHAWNLVIAQLEGDVSRADFDACIKPIRPQGIEGGTVTLLAPTPFAQSWLDSRVKNRVTMLLAALLGQSLNVRFALSEPAPEPAPAIPPVERSEPEAPSNGAPSTRKMVLQRAYGSERARLIQPERGMFLTLYFFNNWLPLLGHSAMAVILAARSLCYWNPVTGELRNTIETDMSELARRAAVSVRTVKDVLAQPLVRAYFLRYTVRRMMTPNGVRTAGICLQVRMDDPITPDDQAAHHLGEPQRWYTAAFEDETED